NFLVKPTMDNSNNVEVLCLNNSNDFSEENKFFRLAIKYFGAEVPKDEGVMPNLRGTHHSLWWCRRSET
ncbi:MAG: hypothetical protein Q8842_03415, partial [Candidatus Phytoplasma australasiaticum]|nr:hypothetical protein [Candidatus Phytoplasma australasiaticum]